MEQAHSPLDGPAKFTQWHCHSSLYVGKITKNEDYGIKGGVKVAEFYDNDGEPDTMDAILRANEAVRMLNAHDAMVAALRAADDAMGMHGPCKNNSCADCKRAGKLVRAALKLAVAP